MFSRNIALAGLAALQSFLILPVFADDAKHDFRTAFKREGWDEKILAIKVLTPDWQVENAGGAPVRRTKTGQILAKNQSNTCMLYLFTIEQPYTGSSFGQAQRRSHSSKEAPCK